MKFYRFELLTTVSASDEIIHFPLSRHQRLICQEFEMIKETPKGYWISLFGFSNLYKKWVPKVSKKRYAYPSKKEALNGYIKRTERRIKILENGLYDAKEGLKLALKESNHER